MDSHSNIRQGVLRNFAKFTGKHLCQSLFFNKVAGLKKETLGQVFSCEFYEISKNTFSYRTPLVAASHSRAVSSHQPLSMTPGYFQVSAFIFFQ